MNDRVVLNPSHPQRMDLVYRGLNNSAAKAGEASSRSTNNSETQAIPHHDTSAEENQYEVLTTKLFRLCSESTKWCPTPETTIGVTLLPSSPNMPPTQLEALFGTDTALATRFTTADLLHALRCVALPAYDDKLGALDGCHDAMQQLLHWSRRRLSDPDLEARMHATATSVFALRIRARNCRRDVVLSSHCPPRPVSKPALAMLILRAARERDDVAAAVDAIRLAIDHYLILCRIT